MIFIELEGSLVDLAQTILYVEPYPGARTARCHGTHVVRLAGLSGDSTWLVFSGSESECHAALGRILDCIDGATGYNGAGGPVIRRHVYTQVTK